jgi:hypothetical protein
VGIVLGVAVGVACSLNSYTARDVQLVSMTSMLIASSSNSLLPFMLQVVGFTSYGT